MIVPITEELSRTGEYHYLYVSATTPMVAISADELDRLRDEHDRYRRALDAICNYMRGTVNGWIIRALPAVREIREMARDVLEKQP